MLLQCHELCFGLPLTCMARDKEHGAGQRRQGPDHQHLHLNKKHPSGRKANSRLCRVDDTQKAFGEVCSLGQASLVLPYSSS